MSEQTLATIPVSQLLTFFFLALLNAQTTTNKKSGMVKQPYEQRNKVMQQLLENYQFEFVSFQFNFRCKTHQNNRGIAPKNV